MIKAFEKRRRNRDQRAGEKGDEDEALGLLSIFVHFSKSRKPEEGDKDEKK